MYVAHRWICFLLYFTSCTTLTKISYRDPLAFCFFYTIVRRPSVRPSVCVSGRSKLLLLLARGSDPHQTCTQCSPGRSASTMCSRSKVTRYGHFCCSTEIAPGRSQMDGSSLIKTRNCKMGMSYSVIDGLVSISRSVTGRFLRKTAKWLQWVHYISRTIWRTPGVLSSFTCIFSFLLLTIVTRY